MLELQKVFQGAAVILLCPCLNLVVRLLVNFSRDDVLQIHYISKCTELGAFLLSYCGFPLPDTCIGLGYVTLAGSVCHCYRWLVYVNRLERATADEVAVRLRNDLEGGLVLRRELRGDSL